MKLAIMQPYFFPYLGYFQLMHAVNVFVIYDDVQFIKGGWINRNYILSQGRRLRLTLSLDRASPNKKINEIYIIDNKKQLLKTIEQSYKKAPYFSDAFELVMQVMEFNEKNLSLFLSNGLKCIAEYLNLDVDFMTSSSIEKNNHIKGQQKVIDICKRLGAAEYINLIGGQKLYSINIFNDENLHLKFIRMKDVFYNQYCSQFIPSLSIIDVLMFNSRQEISQLLPRYDLV